MKTFENYKNLSFFEILFFFKIKNDLKILFLEDLRRK